MLVKPKTAISDTALLSTKPFIDHWVIFSDGLGSKDRHFIKNTLSGIEGQFVDYSVDHYGNAKTALLREAQSHADWVLMLDMSESLCGLEPQLTLPKNADAGRFDVTRNNAVTSEARLFSSNSNAYFNYPAAERVVLPDSRVSTVPPFSIHNRATHPDYTADKIANRFLLDAALGEYELDADLSLTLGKIELANNQLELALTHFERIIERALPDKNSKTPYDGTSSDDSLWMAYYLSGGIHANNNELTRAMESWLAAFELAPSRGESLLRLAEIHFAQGDFKTVASLAEQARDINRPTAVDYHEPATYSHSADVLLAQAWHALGRSADAIESLRTLLKRDLTNAIKNEVRSSLREIESETKEENGSNQPTNQALLTHSKTQNRGQPKLTIGMATHDDFDGVYFSIMSLVLYHQECLEEIEILIIDNSPGSKHGEAVRGLAKRAPNVRYVAADEYRGTAIRERIFQEAKGPYVLCMDCHVFLHADALGRLISYFDTNPDSRDILHGPIFYDNHEDYSTHMTPEWQSGFYGRWAKDNRGERIDNAPFEIPMQGLGLFACVKQHWPGFNRKFRGFGGEEGYIHEKFRQHGGRAVCLPFLRWTHRFDRPNAPTYENSWEDRIRNYLIGWDELGLNTRPLLKHFSDLLGEDTTSSVHARFLLEKAGPLWRYDSIYMYGGEQFQAPLLNGLGGQYLVQKVAPESGLRAALEQSSERGLANVLLLVAKTDSKTEFESAFAEATMNIDHWRSITKDVQLFENSVLQAAAVTAPALKEAAACLTTDCLMSLTSLRSVLAKACALKAG